MNIHWLSFILGMVILFSTEVICAIYLIRRFNKNTHDFEEEDRTVDRLTKEYDDHARGSK